MRYALISDIHANLPALDAVLADIAARADIDATYHLGDLVGYAPWPNEIVQRILAARRSPASPGTTTRRSDSNYKHCGCRYEDPRQDELAHLSFEWTKAHVSPEAKRVLASLPFRIDLRPLGGHMSGPTVILVHGTPTLNTVYLTEDRPDKFLSRWRRSRARGWATCCASATRTSRGIASSRGFTSSTPGSVGRPKDGDWRAGYVILDVDKSNVSVEFVRVEYDLNAAAQAIRESDLPNEFADYLAAGGTLAPTASEIDGEAG